MNLRPIEKCWKKFLIAWSALPGPPDHQEHGVSVQYSWGDRGCKHASGHTGSAPPGRDRFWYSGTITLFTSVINNLLSFRMGELVVKYVGQYSEQDDPRSAAAAFKLAAIFEMLASLAAFGLVIILAQSAPSILPRILAQPHYLSYMGWLSLQT